MHTEFNTLFGLKMEQMEAERGAFLLYDPRSREQAIVVCSEMCIPDDYISSVYRLSGLRIGLMEYNDIQALVDDGFNLRGTELIGEVSEQVYE